jgi:CBS domain-containing protein
MAIAGEIASWPAKTVPADTTVAMAARAMRDDGIGDVLVVDGSHRLIGVLTDRDVVVRVVAEARDPKTTPVSEVCTSNPVTLEASAPAEDAVLLMKDHLLHRIAVVDDEGHPVGVITLDDLAASSYADQSDVLAIIARIAKAYRERSRALHGL